MKSVNVNKFTEMFLDIFDKDWDKNPNYQMALNMILDSIEHLQDREDPPRRGYRLMQARRRKGLSQVQVAKIAECSVQSLRKYEYGEVEIIRPDIKEKLKKFLEVDI